MKMTMLEGNHTPRTSENYYAHPFTHVGDEIQWKSVQDVFNAQQPQITTVKNAWKKSVGQVFMNPVRDKSGLMKAACMAILILVHVCTLGTVLAYLVYKERRDCNTISVNKEKLKKYLAFLSKNLSSENAGNWNAAIGATEEGGKGNVVFSPQIIDAKQEIKVFYENELCPELVRLYDNIKQVQKSVGESYSEEACRHIVADAIIKRYELTKCEQIPLMILVEKFVAFNVATVPSEETEPVEHVLQFPSLPQQHETAGRTVAHVEQSAEAEDATRRRNAAAKAAERRAAAHPEQSEEAKEAAQPALPEDREDAAAQPAPPAAHALPPQKKESKKMLRNPFRGGKVK